MTLLHPHDNPWRRPVPGVDKASLCWLLEEASAVAFGVASDDLRAPSRRGAAVAFARQVAMYLGHVVLGLNYSDVGRLFHRDRTTAAHACRLVEDRRDDPDVDLRLDVLERVCAEAIFGPSILQPVNA